MKIERINENQIRCTLTSFDLSVRNLNLGELAYGSEKARSLFREMIQKASNEVGFDAEDIPLMVEAIPLSNESVMLVITKIEDPEELDTRFSKFSPLSEDEQEGMWNSLAHELLEGADGLMELLKRDMLGLAGDDIPLIPFPDHGELMPVSRRADGTDSADAGQATENPDEPAVPSVQTRIYRFNSLDLVMDAAAVTGSIYPGPNTLYKKPATSQYYLVISSADTDMLIFSRICNILAEYGDKVKQETGSEAYYQEHYEVIVQDQALQKLMLV